MIVSLVLLYPVVLYHECVHDWKKAKNVEVDLNLDLDALTQVWS